MNNKRKHSNRSVEPAKQLPPTAPPLEGGAVIASSQWSGPLPPPAALERFDQIAPGSARIIIDEFVKEADHRRLQEDRDQRFQVRYAHLGQALAAIFAVGCLSLSGFAIVHGHPVAGAVIGAGVIVAGVTAFLKRPGASDGSR